MKQIETETIIEASPESVWSILTDFESYPSWNPFIKSIEGIKSKGEKLSVLIQPPNGSSMNFKPTVLVFNENEEFRWIGKLGIKGIFDGEHYFKLTKLSDNETKFIHGEKFSGLLVALMSGVLNKTADGFKLMNEALKTKAENKT